MKQYVVSFLLVLLSAITSIAQDISFDGEYRINPVYSRGFRQPMYEGDKAGLFTMQRTRLIFRYEKQDDLDAEIIIQDRRFWGDQEDRADVANMAVFTAWVEKTFVKNFSVRLGRQMFSYDEQHILGDPNWVGTRGHDAALFKYEREGLKLHAGLAYNANGQELEREAYRYKFMYKNLQFAWLEKKIGKSKFTFTLMNRGMEKGDTTSAYMQTFGPYANIYLSDKVSLKGLYYHQLGENTAGQDVNASFYSAQLIFKPSKRVQLIAGVDAGSGTNESDLSNTKSTSFDRQYGLLHGHFGYMDYFYVLSPTLVGVHDYYIKGTVKVSDKLSFENHVHDFETSARLNDPLVESQVMSRHLGIENDFMVNYNFSSNFKMQIAYCTMFKTSTLDALFGGEKSKENQVLYAVITATPNFFKSKTEKSNN